MLTPTGGEHILPDHIVPDIEGGNVLGEYVLWAFAADPPFALLGAEEGDRVDAVNGVPVDAPQTNIFRSFAWIRTGMQVSVDIHRRGQRVRLDYDLR